MTGKYFKDFNINKKYDFLIDMLPVRLNNNTKKITPYLSNDNIIQTFFNDTKNYYKNISDCLSIKEYKRNYPFVINRKIKNVCSDFYIRDDILFGLISLYNNSETSIIDIKNKFKILLPNPEDVLFRFSLKLNYKTLYGTNLNEFFLTPNDLSIKDIYNNSEDTKYKKYYIKSLLNLS